MASLPKGYYTLGDGHIHKIPTKGWSKWYVRGTRKFRYDNENKDLVLYLPAYDDEGNRIPGKYEEADRIGLSFYNWVENPDYWVDQYNSDIDEMISYNMP